VTLLSPDKSGYRTRAVLGLPHVRYGSGRNRSSSYSSVTTVGIRVEARALRPFSTVFFGTAVRATRAAYRTNKKDCACNRLPRGDFALKPMLAPFFTSVRRYPAKRRIRGHSTSLEA
jgi:hypothetical protein